MAKPISVVSSSGPSVPPYATPQGLLRIPSVVLRLILKLLDPLSFNMAQRSCRVLQLVCRFMNDRPIRSKSNYDFCLEAVKQGYLGILKLFYEMQIQQRQNKT